MGEDNSPLDVIESLAEAINRHDVDAIMRILHEGHTFIDSRGNQIQGRDIVRAAWERYFTMVPDYWLRVDQGVISEGYIALFGRAGGTLAVDGELKEENLWETTAAWKAVIVDGQVTQWQVYSDNEPIRALMRETPVRGKRKKRKTAAKKSRPRPKSRPRVRKKK